LYRVLFGLLVCCLVLFASGVAYAAPDADTDNIIIIEPVSKDYELSGVLSMTVKNFISSLTPDEHEALLELIRKLDVGEQKVNAIIAIIEFIYKSSGSSSAYQGDSVVYTWKEGEFLYNFRTEKFDSYNDMEAHRIRALASENDKFETGSGEFEFNKYNDYDGSSEPDKGSFISARFDIEEVRRKSGGGCSALQIGAIVLFMLPALSLIRRRKK